MDLEKIQNDAGTALVSGISSGVENQELYLKNLRESMAPNTFAAYGKQWRSFTAWCVGEGRSSLPASSGTVAEYLDHLRETGHSFSTLQQVAAAIAREHRAMGLRSPSESEEVRVALSAAARTLGRTPKKKAALTLELLRDVLKVIPEEGLKNLRDRALLAVGFMGGFRRSELVTLRASDLERKKDNGGRPIIVISLRHSKTDQESRGTVNLNFQ